MDTGKKQTIWRGIVLFMLVMSVNILLHTSRAAAAVPEGRFTPSVEDGKGVGLTFTFTGDNTAPHGFVANVESYRSNAIVNGTLTIPDTIYYPNKADLAEGQEQQEIKVAGILRGVFKSCNSMTSLVLSESIDYIGQEAFSGCVNLREIRTGPTVSGGYLTAEEIEYRAFYGCTALTGITLGEKVNSNSGVKTVQREAFMGCSQLNTVEIGPSVTWIEGGAFANCGALDGLSGRLKIRDNQDFFIQNGILYYRANERSNVLILCPAGTPIGNLTSEENKAAFPENVTEIKNEAFYGCTGLSSIHIPDTVTTIGDQAFYNCTSLGNVKIPNSVKSIGTQVFVNCSNGLCIICVSGSVAEQYAITNNIPRSVECTVTFYNNFTGERLTKTVLSGQTVDPPMGWERAGYVLRWTDNFDSNTVITANRTITTVWHKLYTVTFRDEYSGNVSVVENVEEGTEAEAPNWTRKGYQLTWSTQTYKKVTADITVNAVWLVYIAPGDSNQEPEKQYKKGDKLTVGNIIFKISSIKDKRVRVMGLVNENVTTVTVPNSITFGGTKYLVTCINANAFRNNKSIKKVTLGVFMRSIEHYAFYNCTKLKKVVIKSKIVSNFSNYAFKKTPSSLKVYVPTYALRTTYRVGLLDAGMSKKAKVIKY